jgi:hypothetical protein
MGYGVFCVGLLLFPLICRPIDGVVTGLRQRLPGLTRSIPCDSSGGRSGTVTCFFPVLRFSPVTIIPSMLRTHLHLTSTVIRRTSGRSLGTFKQSNYLVV